MLHEFVERGWIAVVCNYRLAPRLSVARADADVTRTFAWAQREHCEHGGEPDRGSVGLRRIGGPDTLAH